MFMAPFEYVRKANHPYVTGSPATHGHFKETPLRYPAYSAATVPLIGCFASHWRRKVRVRARCRSKSGARDGLQNTVGPGKENQTALLKGFASHIKHEQSLCFIYAKEVPFVEDSRRVLIGAGRVTHVGEPVEYLYQRAGKLRAVLWELMVQHTIRPGYKDGFLMPYYELIGQLEKNQDLDPTDFTAFAPEDHFEEFSFGSELVSHDGAIEALQNLVGALTRSKSILKGTFEAQINWLHARISELWKMRGPCPGLGAALCAFGLEFGTFVAREIETKVGDNEDPWPLMEKAFREPKSVLSPESARQLGTTLCEKWKKLPAERKSLLRLLSRFNLQPEEATNVYVKEEREEQGVDCSDADLLKNPYLIYESTKLTANPVSLWTVDRGLFPEEVIRSKHPLPEPSALDGGTDARRVRAFTVEQLEKAADNGHTLQRKHDVVLAIRKLDLQPSCPVDGDLMNVVESSFTGAIVVTELKDKSPGYQLARLEEVGKTIRDSVSRRRGGVRHKIQADWRASLDKHLPSSQS